MVHSYEIPSLLEEIMTWEKEIKQKVPYLETPTGYFLQFDPTENGGYRSSPADAIMFAGTGMDGIHFSFLTEFGSVTDLSLAPIIRVDPMDFGNCAKIVAKNIRDFFTLHFSDHEGLLLNDFESKEHYLTYLKDQEGDDEESEYFDKKKWQWQKNEVRDFAMLRFGFQPILDGYAYMQEVRQARWNELIVTTSDGLGVIVRSTSVDGQNKPVPHPWHMKEIPDRELEQLKSYIVSAEQAGLFGFIRDCQVQGVDDYEVIQAICDQLISLGLPLEAKRLAYCMDMSSLI
ncbi:hypothetical protein [Paenibacillus mendelii]|uniref:Uncharacterized protein n=1 Tax=Paenibacillus mendelii TaxID=206163 RepID=A0ABV6JDM6_9BACL|nr:hypothetical protein [Paenibacillus mendelii]MCQ6563477.1 hypothetical protein [Paenibacillus mendelii]